MRIETVTVVLLVSIFVMDLLQEDALLSQTSQPVLERDFATLVRLALSTELDDGMAEDDLLSAHNNHWLSFLRVRPSSSSSSRV